MTEYATQFLAPALVLFATGFLGAVFKKNLIVVFMCVELMLCGAMLAMLSFSAVYGDLEGAVFSLFVLAIAAAEVALGLAIIVKLFRTEGTVSTSGMNSLGD